MQLPWSGRSGTRDLVVRRDFVAVPAASAAELALNPRWLPVGVSVAGELPRRAHRASLGPPSACTRHCYLTPAAKGPWIRGGIPLDTLTVEIGDDSGAAITSIASSAGQCWRSSRSTRASHASTTDRGTSGVACAALLKASAVRWRVEFTTSAASSVYIPQLASSRAMWPRVTTASMAWPPTHRARSRVPANCAVGVAS